MPDSILDFEITVAESGVRIDKFLSDNVQSYSREKLKDLFKESRVTNKGVVIKPSYKLTSGDRISISIPEAKTLEVVAQDIPLTIVYEDEDIAIIDKPQGMVVHPAPGNYDGTMVNAIMYHIKDLSSINGVIRPGIVHRIDKDTSGLIVVAKNDVAHNHLAAQFKVHSITREYMAIVKGVIKENEGHIDAPIGRDDNNRLKYTVRLDNSKRAVTDFYVLERQENTTLVRLKLHTGRTHQIRCHMEYIGHPVVGDPMYGKRSLIDKEYSGQLLHAYKLGFIHPRTEEYIEFTSSLPDYFYTIINDPKR